jgi:hypothetical protein
MSTPAPKNPPPTEEQNYDAIAQVNAKIDGAYPSVGSVSYPQPGDTVDAFAVEGVTSDQIAAANIQILGYYASPGSQSDNQETRYWGYTKIHPPISRTIADCFQTGAPLPDKSAFIPPTQIKTVSESEIKARINYTNPVRYDGAPCYDPGLYESTFKALIAQSYMQMVSNESFSGIPSDTLWTLAVSQWGLGQTYFPQNFDPHACSGFTSAQVFYKYDKTLAREFPNGPTA